MSTAALIRIETVDALYVADRVSAHRAYTPEGYLILLGVPIARTGSQTYRADEVDRDGSLGLTGFVEVQRPASEVFSPAAILSFEGKAVVSPHPPQFLNAENTQLYAKGHAQRVRAGTHPETGAPVLLADLIITDKALIQMIEDGHRLEISGGYTYDLDVVSDEHDPRPAFAQRNIRGNHVAIVASGRAGSDIRVLDAAPSGAKEATMAEETKPATQEGPGMFAQFAAFCKELGLRLVSTDAVPVRKVEATDGESEAVERNKKVNAKAMTLRSRVEDAGGELEEEEKGAKKPDDKTEKEDKEMEGGEKKEFKGEDRAVMDERIIRAIDRLERTVARATGQDASECTCDGKGTCEHCKSKEGKDADLIPVATLHGDEVPENPIPGADEALAQLRKMRPFIAQSGNREAIDGYNEAVKRLKAGGAREGADGYGALLDRKKPAEVEDAEARAHVKRATASDARQGAQDDFVEMAAKFHRQNPNEVKLEKKQTVQ